MDALKFFNNKKAEFASNRFSRKEAIIFVKKLFKLGASKIEINYAEDVAEDAAEDIYADTMIVYLPKSLSKRLDIVVAIWDAFPDEISDGHVNWRKDKSVLLWWD